MLRTPSGGAVSGTATADSRLVSIGTVLNQLRDEFPEVTISKIRFLESEGLVEPQRTPSGYRKFSAQDVERLACILRLQRDHYLPLKVIREYLEALERGERVQLPVTASLSSSGEQPVEDALSGPGGPTSARLDRAELLAATGVAEEELAAWESYGLVTPAADGGYDIETATVARILADLGRFGLEPRHLRPMKAAAEREADLVEQLVAPLRRHRNPQTRAHAEARSQELAELSARLHAALVRTALRSRTP
ncbi:MerR family transcriptional regulator [Streptomyces sp. M19]